MFFIATPYGDIAGDSKLVQDARDRGESTFDVQAHGHQFRIQIYESGMLKMLAIDGKPIDESEIG